MRFLTTLLVACSSPVSSVAPVAKPIAAVADVACDGARYLPSPASPDARGPWPVGVMTVRADDVVVEVWYPATPGSHGENERYDLRTEMPPAEAAKIPDADNAWLPCDCVRDLPIDRTHGPYPVIVFLHGAASFRAQSAFLVTQWASRGFIVIAPDLPGVGLRAVLGDAGGMPTGTPLAMMDLIQHPTGDDPLAFARASIGARTAVVGHSLGAVLAATVGDRADVRISLAGLAGESLALYGETDRVAPPPSTATGRVGVVAGAGHLAFTDLCALNALAIARAHGVEIPEILATLATDGCRPTDAPFAKTAPIIRAATTAVLEEKLHCAKPVADIPGVRWIH